MLVFRIDCQVAIDQVQVIRPMVDPISFPLDASICCSLFSMTFARNCLEINFQVNQFVNNFFQQTAWTE